MASPNLSEIVTTTIQSRSKQLADNVSNNNALLQRLRRRGNMRPVTGGNVILQELEYAENATYKRYSGYDTLDISPSDVFTSASFDWKQAAVAVTISGLEEIQNAGDEQQIDLLESRITNAERTFRNNHSTDVYSDGTADGGKQIGGLQTLVADDPTTGTVGGISRATWTFWRNGLYDFSVESATASATTIQTAMNTLWMRTHRNSDSVDLIVADNTYFEYYWASLQNIQRITRDGGQSASAGFRSLDFMGADVVLDGGIDGACPSAHMYFLNTEFIHYRPSSRRNMVALDPDRYATNQDAMVKLIGWAGNMTLSNAQLQEIGRAHV